MSNVKGENKCIVPMGYKNGEEERNMAARLFSIAEWVRDKKERWREQLYASTQGTRVTL